MSFVSNVNLSASVSCLNNNVPPNNLQSIDANSQLVTATSQLTEKRIIEIFSKIFEDNPTPWREGIKQQDVETICTYIYEGGNCNIILHPYSSCEGEGRPLLLATLRILDNYNYIFSYPNLKYLTEEAAPKIRARYMQEYALVQSIFQALLTAAPANIDLNARSVIYKGKTPRSALEFAIEVGDYHNMRGLFERGAKLDFEYRDEQNNALINYAAEKCSSSTISFLHEEAKKQLSTELNNVLNVALLKPLISIISQYDQRVDMLSIIGENGTPLHKLALECHIPSYPMAETCTENLLSRGGVHLCKVPNKHGETPIQMAARLEKKGMIELMLKAGAEKNWVNLEELKKSETIKPEILALFEEDDSNK